MSTDERTQWLEQERAQLREQVAMLNGQVRRLQQANRAIELTADQLLRMPEFRFAAPITVQRAIPVGGADPSTVMVTDCTSRVFFLLGDGSADRVQGGAA